LNDDGEMVVEGWIATCYLRELVLHEDLGETNVGVTILSCENNESQIMSIWKWPFVTNNF